MPIEVYLENVNSVYIFIHMCIYSIYVDIYKISYYIMNNLGHMHSGELVFCDNESNCYISYLQAHYHSKQTYREVLNTLICSIIDGSRG